MKVGIAFIFSFTITIYAFTGDYQDYTRVKVRLLSGQIVEAELRGPNHPNKGGYLKCMYIPCYPDLYGMGPDDKYNASNFIYDKYKNIYILKHAEKF